MLKSLPIFDRASLERIAAKYRVDVLIAFGSVVKGCAGPNSDFDVLVWRFRTKRDHGDPDRRAAEEMALFEELNRAFDTREGVDVVTAERATSLLLMEAARHGVPLFENQTGDFVRFVLWAASCYRDDAKYRELNRQYLARKARQWTLESSK